MTVTFTGTIRVPLEDKIDYVTVELFNTVKHQRDEMIAALRFAVGAYRPSLVMDHIGDQRELQDTAYSRMVAALAECEGVTPPEA